MDTLCALLFGLAVLLVAMTGLTATLGAEKLRDGFARAAAGATIAALTLRYASALAANTFKALLGPLRDGAGMSVSPVFLGLFVLGHVGLACAWAYARFGPATVVENIERSRGRGRDRVMPALQAEVPNE